MLCRCSCFRRSAGDLAWLSINGVQRKNAADPVQGIGRSRNRSHARDPLRNHGAVAILVSSRSSINGHVYYRRKSSRIFGRAGMTGIVRPHHQTYRHPGIINDPDKAKDRRLFWRCVFITFIISSVWLWVGEHHQTIDLQNKLNALTLPTLRGNFGMMTTRSYPNETATEVINPGRHS